MAGQAARLRRKGDIGPSQLTEDISTRKNRQSKDVGARRAKRDISFESYEIRGWAQGAVTDHADVLPDSKPLLNRKVQAGLVLVGSPSSQSQAAPMLSLSAST